MGNDDGVCGLKFKKNALFYNQICSEIADIVASKKNRNRNFSFHLDAFFPKRKL